MEHEFTCAHDGCGLSTVIDSEDESANEYYQAEEHAAIAPGHDPDWRDSDGNAPGEL